MNIGFDAKRVYNNFTGLGNYCRTLIHNLSEFYPENRYFLYTPKRSERPETKEFSDTSRYKIIEPNTLWKAYWRSVSIKENLKKDRIQVFHGLSHEIPFGIDKIGVKSVVTIHDLIFKTYPNTYSAIDRKIYDFKFKYACQHADKIVAISQSTRNDIIKYYDIAPEKIEVIYQACNPVFWQKQSQEMVANTLAKTYLPSAYLLYVGSIIPRKNLLTLLKAYSFLPKSLQIPLVVVGNGSSYKREMQTYCLRAGLEQLIIWKDNVQDNNELQALYQGAKAFIYPSVFEGFGLPVAEALLCGTPVITSNVSSLPEAAGPSSFCINPLSAEEIANAIATVLTNSKRAAQMSEEGEKYVRSMLEPANITRQMQQLYTKLL